MSSTAIPSPVAAPRTGLSGFVRQILSDREQFFAEVEAGEALGAKLAYSLGVLVSLSALYGRLCPPRSSCRSSFSARSPSAFPGSTSCRCSSGRACA